MATGRVPTTANSPLTAKGDLFTYDTNQARLAVGNNGDTLLADSSTSTGLRYNPQNALANPIINGGFDIWQRGTSFTSASVYTADRWFSAPIASGMTISRQTTSDTTNLPNIQYALRVARNSGSTTTSNFGVMSTVETVNTLPFSGKPVTFSFYARAGANYSPSSSILQIRLYTGTGTDQRRDFSNGFTGDAEPLNVFSVVLTNTWQRFVATGTIAATATEMAVAFFSQTTGTAGANDWFEVTGVQIDLGTYTASSAPTFRRSGGTIQGELGACMRYYFRIANGDVYSPFGMGYASSATEGIFLINHPVPMRVRPTSIDYNSIYTEQYDGVGSTAGTATISNSSPFLTRINITGLSGLTAGRTMFAYSNNNTAGYLGFSAEL